MEGTSTAAANLSLFQHDDLSSEPNPIFQINLVEE
jgi:hypothetical protein